MLQRYFRLNERGTSVIQEVRGGLVTFVTMAYIVVLNPLILGSLDPSSPSAKRDVLGMTLSVPQVAAVTAATCGTVSVAPSTSRFADGDAGSRLPRISGFRTTM